MCHFHTGVNKTQIQPYTLLFLAEQTATSVILRPSSPPRYNILWLPLGLRILNIRTGLPFSHFYRVMHLKQQWLIIFSLSNLTSVYVHVPNWLLRLHPNTNGLTTSMFQSAWTFIRPTSGKFELDYIDNTGRDAWSSWEKMSNTDTLH